MARRNIPQFALALILACHNHQACGESPGNDSTAALGQRVHTIALTMIKGTVGKLLPASQSSPGYQPLCKAARELLRGGSQAAIRLAGQALQEDHTLAAAYAIRGMAESEFEVPQKVVDDLRKAFALDKRWATVGTYDMRRQAYGDLQNWGAAVADTDKAISLVPDQGWRYRERGEYYYAWHKNDQALKDFTTSVKLEPKNFETYKMRGDLLSSIGKYKEAVADYSQALKLKPGYSMIYRCRANCYDKLGRAELAKKDRQAAGHGDDTSNRSIDVEDLLGK